MQAHRFTYFEEDEDCHSLTIHSLSLIASNKYDHTTDKQARNNLLLTEWNITHGSNGGDRRKDDSDRTSLAQPGDNGRSSGTFHVVTTTIQMRSRTTGRGFVPDFHHGCNRIGEETMSNRTNQSVDWILCNCCEADRRPTSPSASHFRR